MGITSLQAGDPWGWASREEALGQLQNRPLEHGLLQAGLQAMPGFSVQTSTFRPDRFAGRPQAWLMPDASQGMQDADSMNEMHACPRAGDRARSQNLYCR